MAMPSLSPPSAPPSRSFSLVRSLTGSGSLTRVLSSPSILYHRTKKIVAYGVNIYLLLLFLPLGILSGVLGWNTVLVSVFNFLAIIPLSALVSASSDNLCDYVGDIVGSLLNATFGNSVELSAGILAVVHGHIDIAQSVMIGSILSDILLVLGCCMLAASFDKYILRMNSAVAGTLSSLMVIATMAIVIPTALYSTFRSQASEIADKVVSFSRGTALVLLLLYLCYLYFQMKTHKHLFLEVPQHGDGAAENEVLQSSSALPPQANSRSIYLPILALIASSLGIIPCTHFLIDSIGTTARATHLSTSFIATILIPIASNSPECAAVVAASRGGDVDFAISIIVGSILQISLFVIPFLVVLGWMIQQQMTLNFETFHTVILFVSVLVVNHILREGKYTYIHGTMLTGFYAILATAFYFR